MDPTENLRKQLELAAEIVERADEDFDEHQEMIAGLGEELAGLVRALDEWIKKGGFLPKQWDRPPPRVL